MGDMGLIWKQFGHVHIGRLSDALACKASIFEHSTFANTLRTLAQNQTRSSDAVQAVLAAPPSTQFNNLRAVERYLSAEFTPPGLSLCNLTSSIESSKGQWGQILRAVEIPNSPKIRELKEICNNLDFGSISSIARANRAAGGKPSNGPPSKPIIFANWICLDRIKQFAALNPLQLNESTNVHLRFSSVILKESNSILRFKLFEFEYFLVQDWPLFSITKSLFLRYLKPSIAPKKIAFEVLRGIVVYFAANDGTQEFDLAFTLLVLKRKRSRAYLLSRICDFYDSIQLSCNKKYCEIVEVCLHFEPRLNAASSTVFTCALSLASEDVTLFRYHFEFLINHELHCHENERTIRYCQEYSAAA
jgi:hypothetical protein